MAYSAAFLRCIAAHTGDMHRSKGIISALVSLGETTLAEVAWDRPGLPGRVNVKNLCRVGSRAFFEG